MGLSERAARAALDRLVADGRVLQSETPQYGQKGRIVTWYRLPPEQQEFRP